MIYLDYHSSTKCDPRVVEKMLPYFTEEYGNSSAVHTLGNNAKKALDGARSDIANIINASPDNVIFTHGATEANNIVLRSFENGRVITTNSEHSSVRDTVNWLFLNRNLKVDYLKINENGTLNIEELEKLLNENNVDLVSIIGANNEIGTIHDLKIIGQLCRKYNALFHTDCTQAVGKIDIDVDEMCIDALSFSAHKIYGPKGIGALYIRDCSKFDCLITGGRQEVLTSGTVNIPAAVGFAYACDLMVSEKTEAVRIECLRNKLLSDLRKYISGITVNGTMDNRLYNNLNISIKDIPAELLVLGMEDVCISTGSACLSRNPEPSHVIIALDVEQPECAIRFGLGRWNTEQEIGFAVMKIAGIVNSIRNN